MISPDSFLDAFSHEFIDTHCHLSHIINKGSQSQLSDQEIQEIKRILHRAHDKKVTKIIEVGTTKNDSILSLEISKKINNVFPVIGIHPHEATVHHQEDILFLKNLLIDNHERVVGIGECGLDKHYPDYNLQAQIDLFKAQIELALEYNKALVVHTRDAEIETYNVLEQYKNQLKRVTIHCYSNSLDFGQQVTSWGWYLGIGGTITYPKNNMLREIVKTVGLPGIVLETDAPFLPPQIIRGKQNTPEQISTIAQYVAQLLGTSIEDVATQTTTQAQYLFDLESN